MRNSTKPLVCGYYTDWNRWDGTKGYGAVGWYRVINPLAKLGYETVGEYTIGGPQTALDMGERGHIWFMKPTDSTGISVLVETAKEMTDSKLIIDLDDDPLNFDEAHPLYKELKEKSREVVRLIESADHVVVSTDNLKHTVEHLNSHITVIPNAIDPEIWKVKKKRKGKTIRIGWIASGSHMADMPIILPVIEEILNKYDNVHFVLAGIVADELSAHEGRVTHVQGTSGYDTYPQFLADLHLDIAIAPLKDTPFNACKSNIKWLENTMLKIPMVLSDVTPYKECVKHGKTGYLVKGTNQWVKHLSWLIENKEKRKEIAENAYKEMPKYFIRHQLDKYKAVFEEVREKDIKLYTSIIGKYDKLNKQRHENANLVAFTDQKSDHWTVRPHYDRFTDNTRNSRIQKIMPHLFFTSEYSIYIDGNIELLVEPQKLVDEWLKDKDIAVFNHAGRKNVFEEADACVHYEKEDPQIIAEQAKAYARIGIKEGLCECGVIVRRHTKRIEELNEKWWAHYCRYSKRDQISFPMVFPMEEVNVIDGSVWNHKWFKYKQHESAKLDK